jgi:predicted cytidylate kinase
LLITVSGPPGSGTTTTAEHVAARLGVELVPGGQVFRAMAVERGLSLPAFGRYAGDHPAVDVELDTRLAERARKGDVVIESRLAGWIVRNEGFIGVTVWIDCDAAVRAARVASRDGTTEAEALAANDERQRLERARYLALYGLDMADLSVYDLVLDSTSTPAAELGDRIVGRARERFA